MAVRDTPGEAASRTSTLGGGALKAQGLIRLAWSMYPLRFPVMPKLLRWSCAAVVMFVIAGVLATAQAQRHGGRRMGGGLAATGLCGSGVAIENGLAVIELMVKPTPEQQAALNELKKAAKLNADAITTACAGPYPATLPDRVSASEKRLEAALSGIRNLRPLVNNFYATLTDEQKNTASSLLILPGL